MEQWLLPCSAFREFRLHHIVLTAIFRIIMATVSHFEQKFKRKDQARVMLNYYLQEKIMRRVERTLYVALNGSCVMYLVVVHYHLFIRRRCTWLISVPPWILRAGGECAICRDLCPVLQCCGERLRASWS